MGEPTHNFIAVDLGASSARVALGRLCGLDLAVEIVHRFEHRAVQSGVRLCWDWERIRDGVCHGLGMAVERCGAERIASISCSSWAQDFGLLDDGGRLLQAPVCYRDERTRGMPESFAQIIAPEELVRRTGCGITPVTALCQLRAMALREADLLRRAQSVLFIADLAHFELCGRRCTDRTMATASQLRNLHTGDWDRDLLRQLDIPSDFLPEIVSGPQVIGHVREGRGVPASLVGVPVISTAGHDTAAATACLPSLECGEFFLNLGTWAMLGCCTSSLRVPAKAAEGLVVLGLAREQWGVFIAGMGMWLIEACRRRWGMVGRARSHEELAKMAQECSIWSTIDPSQTRFAVAADMPAEIADACREQGLQVPSTPGEFARVIFESLATHYASALRRLEQVLDLKARRLTILCGGSRNAYLRGRFAELLGVPVIAGPAEATAVGNIALQAETLGLLEQSGSAEVVGRVAEL